MLKILIADDVKNIRESLTKMVNASLANATIVGATDSVANTIKAIKELKPDVVLLDIEMKDGTGFDVLKQFPNPSFKVIFITAYQQYSLEAFKFSALDYILKPVDPDQLAKAVNKAVEHIDREKLSNKIDAFLYNMEHASQEKKIVLKTAESIHVVSLKDIMYCQAYEGYTNFYLVDKSKILVSRTLGEYDELFSEHHFIRIHQSYLLNINYIKRYEKGEGGAIVLTNETTIPVSARKKEQLMKLLAKL